MWTPDGRRLAFTGQRDGGQPLLQWQAADGTGVAASLTNDPVLRLPSSFSPDGTRLLFTQANNVGVVTLDGAGSAELLLMGTYDERNAEVSPDGRWLAYEANDSGQYEVYVRPFPDVNGGRWQVSTAGGTTPLWARSGQDLFYLAPAGDALMGVRVQVGAVWKASTPATVLRAVLSENPRPYVRRVPGWQTIPDDQTRPVRSDRTGHRTYWSAGAADGGRFRTWSRTGSKS